MKPWLKMLGQAAKAWKEDNAFKHSAAVSFYTLFSLAPVTIIAVSVAGVFLGQDAASDQLEKQITQLIGPESAQTVMAAAQASRGSHESPWATAIGVGLVVFGATTVFGQLQESMNSIWGVRAKPSKRGWLVLLLHRLVSFAMVLTVAFLLLVSLVLTTLLTSVTGQLIGDSPGLLKVADLLGSLVVITLLFGLLFKVMPDVRLRWKEVWVGALLTAGLFTLGRYLIALYLGHSTVASIYGAAGSLVALLVWVYYSCAILFFGVEFVGVYRRHARLPIEPKEAAVLVREQIVTTRHGQLTKS